MTFRNAILSAFALLALVAGALATNVPKGTLTHPGLTLRLAVHNVTGLQDGWYPVDSSEPDPPGDAMAGV